MNDSRQFKVPEPDNKYTRLAQWLQQLLEEPEPVSEKAPLAQPSEHQLELLMGSDYHVRFYQQMPDFIMALLSNDAQAMLHYAPLLYHLAGCRECHQSYLELYDAMQAALYPQGTRPILGQGTRTLAATPQRMLGHLCQTLISQAEAVFRQSRRDQRSEDATVRALLQLALKVSAHIGQSSIRRYALHDLVRVATLAEGPTSPKEEDPGSYTYTPALSGAGTRGRKVVRRADTFPRAAQPIQPIIVLQARGLEGYIRQYEDTLELHLQDLGPSLRGKHILVSVPLGSLLEPIRWIGGNPRAIRSTSVVDASGAITVPLGQTELSLSDPEERNLLEAMFLLLEVHSDNAQAD
ncbi:hypothetical protein EPA93_28120 [Ktedonosporobacter rubrisoli]|uniref:Uncharacterized protein n=1 Tax=Ktedonosporobacter rubrisoli TaxID=2509675 RepID=A0A4P6JW58_KTERU|nr:hypothetical protein [Ktedonosporobacter rubrisoli]QBD79633.1 hypothetical protein EPA93_28120 [Ktedonosporobacter rubrisoli]